MRLLLDTQTVIWFADGAADLSADATAAIEDPTNDVYVSAVVAWEIAIKRGTGKLTAANDYIAATLAAGGRELPVAIAHAQAVKKLPMHHRDPFDRLLVAQALCEDATLVTGDERIAKYPIAVLW